MKITHLLGNGCSFVKNGWVYELNQKKNWTENDKFTQEPNDFPKMTGEKLGIPTDNIATAGAGIRFNIYSTYKWLQYNRDKVKNTLLLFGITALQRDTFLTKAKYPRRLHDNGIIDGLANHLTPSGHIPTTQKEYNYWEARGYDGKEIGEFFKHYYNLVNNEEAFYEMQKLELRMFQAYLNSIGLRHLFINTLASDETVYRKEDLSFLDNLFIFPDGSESWIDYILTYEPTYMTLHPTVYDHLKLSEILAEYIKENYEV